MTHFRFFFTVAASLFAMPVAMAAAQPTVPTAAAPQGIYQQYTPVPTKSPTPASDVAHITLHSDSFSVVAQGALAIPFGDYASQYKTGGGGGVELVYNSSSDMGFAVFAEYNSVPYSVSVVAQPFTSTGLGARVLYELFNYEGMKPFVEGGIGVYFVNRASLGGTSPNYVVEAVQGTGLGFSGGLGAVYAFTPNFGARVVINVTSVGLDNGTGENILYAGPSFGIIYTF